MAGLTCALLSTGSSANATDSNGLESLLNKITARQTAHYAVLIDTSGSMESNGYYQRVLQVLPQFIGSLTVRDQVCLITFSSGAGDCSLVSKSEAEQQLRNLPQHATGVGSNFGRAFKSALDGLRRAGADTAGVLLLSDAELNAPDDTSYKALDSSGWSQLRQEATSLPGSPSVTGYGIPFGKGGDVATVLGTVLPHVRMLDPVGKDLSAALDEARDDTRIREARTAVTADDGKGVAVTWPGAGPGVALSQGSEVHVRLTATTTSLPVHITGILLRGLPDDVIATHNLPEQADLKAGEYRDYVIRFTTAESHRYGFLSSHDAATWRLRLDGTVTSPLADDVRTYLAGQATQLAAGPTGDSLPVAGSVRTTVDVASWALLFGAIVLALTLGIGAWLRAHRYVEGVLVAEAVDSEVSIPLRGRRETGGDLSRLFPEGSAKVRVKSLPGQRGSHPPLRLLCEVQGRPPREATCQPDSRVLLCGIEFHYKPGRR
ncbi:vWA domain-containing protein [Streptomyces sp. NPDC006733]|uniref:vWA domain-containing protein n=1 Tax=Streptomyces sp. NPDC006733 TaxID=3155460 RepID=UPI0033C14735